MNDNDTLDVHSASQADGSDGHTATTRPTWPRCYPHYDVCPHEHKRICPIASACSIARIVLFRAPLSLKHYQQLNIFMEPLEIL